MSDSSRNPLKMYYLCPKHYLMWIRFITFALNVFAICHKVVPNCQDVFFKTTQNCAKCPNSTRKCPAICHKVVPNCQDLFFLTRNMSEFITQVSEIITELNIIHLQPISMTVRSQPACVRKHPTCSLISDTH